jgi:DedD protein
MDRRVKERLVGASILVVLIVLIVPELLSGPAPVAVTTRSALTAPEPTRNVTVDLLSRKTAEPAAAPTPVPVPVPAPTPLRAAPAAMLESAPPSPTGVPAATRAAPAGRGDWAVQLGSFASRANADKLTRQLKAQGFSAYLLSGGSGAAIRYRVRVGPMEDRNAALQATAKLKAAGHIATVVAPAS